MFSRLHFLGFVMLFLLVLGQQQVPRASYADSLRILSTSETPMVHSPVYVNVMRGEKITMPILIDNSGSNETWMVFGVRSSSLNTNQVNMSFDWINSMLEDVPQYSNTSRVFVSISVASDAEIGFYSGQIVVKLRSGIVPPYSTVDVPVGIVINVKEVVLMNSLSSWLDFLMVFLASAVLATSIILAVYIMRNVVRS